MKISLTKLFFATGFSFYFILYFNLKKKKLQTLDLLGSILSVSHVNNSSRENMGEGSCNYVEIGKANIKRVGFRIFTGFERESLFCPHAAAMFNHDITVDDVTTDTCGLKEPSKFFHFERCRVLMWLNHLIA